ncbi:MAG: hypothetical protein GY835_18650 [bacterium]|nr:hypothetical protein [bacterium]
MIFMLAASLALVGSCGEFGFPPEAHRVVFSKEDSQRLAAAEPWVFPPSGPYWTPAPNDIEQANNRAREFLASQTVRKARELRRDLRTYYVQYVGGTESGSRILYLNGFCDKKQHEDWRSEFVTTMDGGICHFHAKYDLKTGRLVHFSVHFPHYWKALDDLNGTWQGRDRLGN